MCQRLRGSQRVGSYMPWIFCKLSSLTAGKTPSGRSRAAEHGMQIKGPCLSVLKHRGDLFNFYLVSAGASHVNAIQQYILCIACLCFFQHRQTCPFRKEINPRSITSSWKIRLHQLQRHNEVVRCQQLIEEIAEVYKCLCCNSE